MTKKEYPKEIDQDEWLRRQNYFLNEQNQILKSELYETKEYINTITYSMIICIYYMITLSYMIIFTDYTI